MKQMLLFTLSLLFFISCNEQNKTDNHVQTNNSQGEVSLSIPSPPPAINTTNDDPNFVKSKDTISLYGPHSITRNILQDKNGIYWFATWEGIINYDGKIFTNVTLKEGLRQFHVFSILEDKTGTLWFGTIGGGVYRYDPSASLGNNFILFTIADHIAGNVILCMMEDKEGNIWFGTDKGVSRYNGYTFTNFTTQDGLNDNFVSTIAQDKTGKIWFGTNGGVNCYVPSALPAGQAGLSKSFTNFTISENLSFHNVRSIIEDKKGNIWIGSQEGLNRCVPSISTAGQTNITNISTNFIGCIYEDKSGNLWLSEGKANSSDMSLTKYDGKSLSPIIEAKQVFGIIEDMSGNIWFGTESGVCRIEHSALLRKDGKSLLIGEAGVTDFKESVSK